MDPLSGVAAPSRAAHVVHLAPSEPSRLARLALPSLAAAAPEGAALRTLVLTTDADTAVAVAELIARDAAGNTHFAALTSAARAERLLAHQTPVGAAIPATAAKALMGRAALVLSEVSMVVIQMPLEGDTEALDAIDTVLAEVPKGARRLLLTPTESAAATALIDRHFLKARRVQEDLLPAGESEFVVIIRALTTGRAARWTTLRRLMDELDPPSTVVLVADEAEATEARAALAALGHPTDGAVRVSLEGAPEHVSLAVFAGIPSAARLAAAIAAQPANLVVMCAPGELPSLRALADAAPVKVWNLDGPMAQAESREAVTRAKLRGLLVSGTLERELRTLAPLFDEFDASEIAAAALALATEAERVASRVYIPAPRAEAATRSEPSARPERSARPGGFGDRGERGDRGDRGDRGPRPERSGGGDRGGRFGSDRPSGGRFERSDRGERPSAGRFDRGDRGERSDRPAGGARFGGGDRPASGGRFGGGDRPASGGRFGGGDRPASGGRFGGGDRPAGGAGRFGGGDRPERPAGGGGRFGGSDRPRGDRPAGGGGGRFDRGDRPAGGPGGGSRFGGKDRPSGGGGRFGGGDRPRGDRPPPRGGSR